jgi:hypothetical protein
MARCQLSQADCGFRAAFEACAISPAAFDHPAHVRLAYVYLAESDVEVALEQMRDSIQWLLQHNGIPRSKYHETLTRAWILAVRHFMDRSDSSSAENFTARNPTLLDSKIMLTHYSAEVLFSPEARAGFVEPDLEPIPQSGPATAT